MSRHLLVTALSSVVAGFALTACGAVDAVGARGAPAAESAGPRSVNGAVESGVTAVLGVDLRGSAFRVEPHDDGTFSLPIASDLPVSVFVLSADGGAQVVRFERSTADGADLTHVIPHHDGAVHLGALSTCDCDHDGADDDVHAEENPLHEIDSDGDGVDDLHDDDVDGDAIPNEHDTDDDGVPGDDSIHDLDDDGHPDLSGHDDVNDGGTHDAPVADDDVGDEHDDDHQEDVVHDDTTAGHHG